MNSFRVSNFRLFDNEGVKLNLHPVTILTGANSSGKSSYVKAMMVFRDYIERVRNDNTKKGEFDPVRHRLAFTMPKLRLRGFSGVLRRDAANEEMMSFSIDLHPHLSTLEGLYTVKYSFISEKERTLGELQDYGELHHIDVLFNDDLVLRINAKANGGVSIDYFNLEHLLTDFICFCEFCYFPYRLQELSKDEYGQYYLDVCDAEGNFSWDRALETEDGKRLSRLLGAKANRNVGAVMNYYLFKLKSVGIDVSKLFKWDFLKAFEKSLQENLIFYFPVLEKIEGFDKEGLKSFFEDIKRRSESVCKQELQFLQDYLSRYVKSVVDDFASSGNDSFKDYYRSLENDALSNFPKGAITSITRLGEPRNIVEEDIHNGLSISFDSLGLTQRGNMAFRNAYGLLSIVQWIEDVLADKKGTVTPSSAFLFRKRELWGDYYNSEHTVYFNFMRYVEELLSECLLPDVLSRLYYFNDSFANVRRLYTFEENLDIVRNVSEYLKLKSLLLVDRGCFSSEVPYSPDTFIKKWIGKEGLGIGKELVVRLESEGLGFYLDVAHEDGTVESLADMGHGITQIISILLQIEVVIMRNALNQMRYNALNPEETLFSPAIIAIEEPEVSLHPCYQSLLSEILYDAATNYGGRIIFLVETHSEYLVRKTQVIVAGFDKEKFKANPFVVYYFKEDGDVYELGYKETGRFTRPFGPGFFDESAKSMYQILKREELEEGKH